MLLGHGAAELHNVIKRYSLIAGSGEPASYAEDNVFRTAESLKYNSRDLRAESYADQTGAVRFWKHMLVNVVRNSCRSILY